ncbi:MAG TPA: F-box protein, partial [Blastocatellia bacterium]|nr:F-box protein [Blastocatellia bacterium]
MGSASEILELPIVALALILDFIPPVELADAATVSSGFAKGVNQRRLLKQRLEFKGRVFGETNEMSLRTVPEIRPEIEVNLTLPRLPYLRDSVRSDKLRRLDLVMCRMSNADFRATLSHVSQTLKELRIEMLCLFKEDAVDTLLRGQRPTLVDQQHLLAAGEGQMNGMVHAGHINGFVPEGQPPNEAVP